MGGAGAGRGGGGGESRPHTRQLNIIIEIKLNAERSAFPGAPNWISIFSAILSAINFTSQIVKYPNKYMARASRGAWARPMMRVHIVTVIIKH